MISFFPEMYPDELLYSVFARYHKYSGNQNVKLSYSDLTGEERNLSYNAVMLPQNLMKLSTQIQGLGISIYDLLYDRTVFPYLVFFENDQQMKIAETWAFTSVQKRTRLSKRIQEYTRTNIGYLKYCPICLEEEYSLYGEAYWHRHHQIPCVLVCTKHRVSLQYSQISLDQCKEGLYALERGLISSFYTKNYLDEEDMKVAIKLSDGIQWLFDNYDLARQLWSKYARYPLKIYLYLLAKKGFVAKNGIILGCQFAHDISRYYGSISLFWDLSYSVGRKENWAFIFFEPTEIKPPTIYHLLIMQYLSGSIQLFFDLLQHEESNHANKPNSKYYRVRYTRKFIENKRCSQFIRFKKCHKIIRASIGTVDRLAAVSTRSWLCKKTYNWALNNLASSEKTRIERILNKEILDHMNRTCLCLPSRLWVKTSIGRFEYYGSHHRMDDWWHERKIKLKSLEETKKVYFKWRLSHTPTKIRGPQSSSIYDDHMPDKKPYKLEIITSKFGNLQLSLRNFHL